MTEPLGIGENDNDMDSSEYEADSYHEEDVDEGAEDTLWGTAITMTW